MTTEPLRDVVNQLVGSSYQDFGRGPLVYDCVGVVLEIVRRVEGVELPDPAQPQGYTAGGFSLLARQFLRLANTSTLAPLDVLHRPDKLSHLSVVEDDRWAVHGGRPQVSRIRLSDILTPATVVYRLKGAPC